MWKLLSLLTDGVKRATLSSCISTVKLIAAIYVSLFCCDGRVYCWQLWLTVIKCFLITDMKEEVTVFVLFVSSEKWLTGEHWNFSYPVISMLSSRNTLAPFWSGDNVSLYISCLFWRQCAAYEETTQRNICIFLWEHVKPNYDGNFQTPKNK